MADPNRPYDPDPDPDPARPYGSEPVGRYPVEGAGPYDPQPAVAATTGTQDPRLGLEVGRYWGGALATIIVAALIGLVGWFLIDQVANQDLQNPPFGDSGAAAWAIAGALFALVAAVLLHLFVLTTPRPATFFGWIVALATIIFAALPFTHGDDMLAAVFAALVWVVLGVAVWSLLTGVLARTLVRRPLTV